jgi:hypothetical protein
MIRSQSRRKARALVPDLPVRATASRWQYRRLEAILEGQR